MTSYQRAYEAIKASAVEGDLEKYYDIYEISKSDIEEAAETDAAPSADDEDADTLKALKLGFQKLHLNRKLYLCSLLALNADGSRPDFTVWSAASDSLESLAFETAKVTTGIHEIIGDEEGKRIPSIFTYPILTYAYKAFRYPQRQRYL